MKAYHLLIIPVLLLSLSASKPAKKAEPNHFNDLNSADDFLISSHPSLKGWFSLDDQPTTRIIVDNKNKSLLFMKNENVIQSFAFSKVTNDVVKCKTDDADSLKGLLKEWFGLDESISDPEQMGNLINAKLRKEHAQAIKLSGVSWENKALSVLYNACVGNSDHDIVLACRDKKLLHGSESIYARDTLHFFNEVKFLALMNSGIDLKAIPSPKAFSDTLKRHGVLSQTVRDYDFVYYDIRNNYLYFGKDSILYTDKKVTDCVFSLVTSPQTVFIHRTDTGDYEYESLDKRMEEMAGQQSCTIDWTKLQGDTWPGEKPEPKFNWTWLYILLAAALLGGVFFYLWKKKLLAKWFHSGKDKDKGILLSSLDPESSILDILKLVDSTLGTQKAEEYERLETLTSPNVEHEKEYEALTKLFKEQEPDRKLYEQLIGSETESELMAFLGQIKKRHPGMPTIDTVAALLDDIHPEDSAKKQIDTVLQRIDKVAKTDLTSVQKSFIRRTVAYDECAKMVSGVDKDRNVPTVLKEALDQFVAKGQTPDGAVDFIQLFKPATDDMKEKEIILREYKAIGKVMDGFRQTIKSVDQIEPLEFWDRAALILSSISECSIPLLDVLDPTNKLIEQRKGILEDIKNDLLVTYISRFFLTGALNENVSAELFKKTVSEKLSEALSRHNAGIAAGNTLLSIQADDTRVKDEMDVLVSVVEKNRKLETMLPFIDSMWDTFVREFIENARTCDDESFIIENALNITYHTVDFLDHFKGGRDMLYCFNYAFLLNGFDPASTGALEFRHNDFAKSTAYSNFIYELAEKYGIEHLKILIDNYFIKP